MKHNTYIKSNFIGILYSLNILRFYSFQKINIIDTKVLNTDINNDTYEQYVHKVFNEDSFEFIFMPF